MKKFFYVLFALSLCCIFTACNINVKIEPPTESILPTENNEYSEDAVVVNSAKELLEAIGPYTSIVIEEGYYNLSEYIEEVWTTEGEKWNDEHEFVKLVKCYDGVEIVITRTDGIVIEGGGKTRQDTEIVVDPRYAAVLTFDDCHGIVLSNFTMGHTDAGECDGNVIDFYDCEKISLHQLDLYGCGVFGLGAYEKTTELYAYDCIIRDCFYGPFDIFGCTGQFDFRKCTMTGSEGYPYFLEDKETFLSFYECTFGKNETEYIYYNESMYHEDCVWSDEVELYGEYGNNDVELPDFENMEVVPFDEKVISSTIWLGACLINTESMETTMLPYTEDGKTVNASINPFDDGTGLLEYCDEEYEFTWYCDSDYTVHFETEEFEFSGIMYAENIEGERPLWMLLHIFEDAIWMY